MTPAVHVEVRGRAVIPGLSSTAFWYEADLWGDLRFGWRNCHMHPMAVDCVRLSEVNPDATHRTILRIIDRGSDLIIKPEARVVLLPEQVTELVDKGVASVYIVDDLLPGDELY